VSIGLLFWLLFILGLIFNGWWGFSRSGDRAGWFGANGFVMVLLFLLGWKVFGFVIQG
jgi:hypothetical protein